MSPERLTGPMRKPEVENWVLELADRVRAGQHTEDSRVELKATWPAPDYVMARKLAGLANAARGEPVLVVVGLDEKDGKVASADKLELATWLPQVQRHFDGPPLEPLLDLNVTVGEATVVAVLFDTSRGPYVVTIPSGGPFDRDVPWRAGRKTRSAKREELVRILVPVSRRPRLDVLSATLQERPAGFLTLRSFVTKEPFAQLEMLLYVTPMAADPITFPYHLMTGRLRSLGGEVSFTGVRFHTPSNPTLAAGSTELNVIGPGSVKLTLEADRHIAVLKDPEVEYVVTLRSAEDQEDLVLRGNLRLKVLQDLAGATSAVWLDERAWQSLR